MRPQKSARSLRWTGCDLAGSCPSQKAKPQAAGGPLAVSIGRTAGHLGGALGVSIDRTAGHLGDGDSRAAAASSFAPIARAPSSPRTGISLKWKSATSVSSRSAGPGRSSSIAPPKPKCAAPDSSATTRQGIKNTIAQARNVGERARRRHVDAQVLAAIAKEYRAGRHLYVVTTNIDAQRTAIWDMGKIAASDDPNAPELFRNILTASASIPGVFSPIFTLCTTRDSWLDCGFCRVRNRAESISALGTDPALCCRRCLSRSVVQPTWVRRSSLRRLPST
jgi:hypothetical protein